MVCTCCAIIFPEREKIMAVAKASWPAMVRLTLVPIIFFIVEILFC